ncbi:MAG: cyclic nucleotide-binding serine/threonine-protein kinase [archaeon]|nr:cyclic nucleotide-binding serine/threonine-protein kinase [archaeon]
MDKASSTMLPIYGNYGLNMHSEESKEDTLNSTNKNGFVGRRKTSKRNTYLVGCDMEKLIEKLDKECPKAVLRSPLRKISVDSNMPKSMHDRSFTKAEEIKIRQTLRNIFLFDSFPDELLNFILTRVHLIEIEENCLLYSKGQANSSFYLVLEGQLEEYDGNKPTNKFYNNWDYFGEKALLNNIRGQGLEYSVKTLKKSKLIVLENAVFQSIRDKFILASNEEKFEFLNTIIVFKSLDDIYKKCIAEKMELVNFDEREQIIQIGSDDKALYLIKSGSVSCELNGKVFKEYGPHNYFGIVSLLLNSERTLNVYAKEQTTCYKITTDTLKQSLGENYINEIKLFLFQDYIFENQDFSEYINKKNIKEVYSKFELKFYSKDQKITNYKRHSKKIVLVIEGNFVHETTKEILYSAGQIIGKDTLTNNVDIPNYLIAFPDALTLEGTLIDISTFLGTGFKLNTRNLLNKVDKYRRSYFLNLISDNTLKMISDGIKTEKYSKGEIIYNENMKTDKFYIIEKGSVLFTKNEKEIREKESDNVFGTYELINNLDKMKNTAKALTDVICITLPKEKFNFIYKEEKKAKEFIDKEISLEDDTIELKDLYFITNLGKGRFGKVTLVHNKKNVYAIKAINRKDADRNKRLANYFIGEKKIMSKLSHPFIERMVKTFKNSENVFLLLEYIKGVNLSDLLSQNASKTIKVRDVRFYISSMILALSYLHSKKIIHRDIKPSNIMVDENGYLKFIDFGASKIITNYTNSICGTPHYIAPEVLKGKGYSFSCDFWSVAICAYEMYYQRYPFGNDAKEVMKIYNEILHEKYILPISSDINSSLNEYISLSLVKNVSQRLCSFNKLRDLEFFSKIDWEGLLKFRYKAPFLPSKNKIKEIDFNNTEHKYEEEINKVSEIDETNLNMEEDEIDSTWANEFL